jgi:uncharacterized membrane protein YkvA (DUF1232 family)
MLRELVEQKIEAIRRLDVTSDATVLAQQVVAHNPAPFRRISAPQEAARREGPAPAEELAALLLARALLRLVLELPDRVAHLLELGVDVRTPPHVRVALLHALAYLVQPDELVHDDAPGGYGYVDDCIVIRTMQLALARMGVPMGIDEGHERRALSLLGLALAPDEFVEMQNLVTHTWNEIHLLHMMPASLATAQAERILRRPLDLRYDWTTPVPPITCTSPRLCAGELGDVSGEGVTIDFRDGGVIHASAAGEIRIDA